MKRRMMLVLFAALLLVLALSACAERHVFGEWIDDVPATCTEDGVKGHYHCEHCGKNFTAEKVEISDEDLVIPATEHVWNNGTTTPATCTEDGAVVYTCTKCNRTRTEVLPAAHRLGDFVNEKAANCIDAGMRAHYQCRACGQYFDAEQNPTTEEALTIAAQGHTEGNWIIDVDPTCTKDGSKHTECTKCRAIQKMESIPAGHDYQEVAKIDETCGQNGAEAHYHCGRCGLDFDMNREPKTDFTIPATGNHTLGELIPEVPATIESTGVRAHYHCSVCKKDLAEDGQTEITNLVIPKKDHDYSELNAKQDATCTAAGHEAYYTCSCHPGIFYNEDLEVVAEEELVILPQHTPVWVDDVLSTCTEEGMRAHYRCERCGQCFTRDMEEIGEENLKIQPKGHQVEEWALDVRPTCTEDGVKHQYCLICKRITQANVVIPATGHSLRLVEQVLATCEENGTAEHYHCDQCGKDFLLEGEEYVETTQEALKTPMKEHTYDWVEKQPATCGACAKQAHYFCEGCGSYFNAEKEPIDSIDIPEEPATGAHVYGDWIEERPVTQTEDGEKAHYHCDICGKNFDADHNEIDIWIPSEYNKGWTPVV